MRWVLDCVEEEDLTDTDLLEEEEELWKEEEEDC